jgi:hypothetical protein
MIYYHIFEKHIVMKNKIILSSLIAVIAIATIAVIVSMSETKEITAADAPKCFVH